MSAKPVTRIKAPRYVVVVSINADPCQRFRIMRLALKRLLRQFGVRVHSLRPEGQSP